jgi:pentatricopeptide repeat protein
LTVFLHFFAGLQYRQCLAFLDEMSELGIKKNVIIFGAALSCMQKACRADIAFQLMDRMKLENISPNVHIYNSAISACSSCGLWEKGFELFNEMQRVGVVPDVVSFNAVTDATSSQPELGRRLFKEGKSKQWYDRFQCLDSPLIQQVYWLRRYRERFLRASIETWNAVARIGHPLSFLGRRRNCCALVV